MADRPTLAWDETDPAGDTAISLGDDAIRDMKTQVREVLGTDHIFEYVGQAENWGYHRQVTFNEQSGNPTAVAGCVILFTKEVSGKCELHCIDEDSNVIQLTSKGDFIGGMAKEVKMWSGTLATIPAGWALCDGSGSLPNLVAKFIRGVATAATSPGSTGGSDSLSSVNPYHYHAAAYNDGTHQHSMMTYYTGVLPSVNQICVSGSSSYDSGKTYTFLHDYPSGETGYEHSHGTDSYGGSQNIDNRPAYYELAFIARV